MSEAENSPTSRPDLVGEAGYVTPYPYLDRLQEKMEELIDRKVPRAGTFCGYCYGRIRPGDGVCGFCGEGSQDWPPVAEIPQDVLRMYRTKQKGEARWVHMGAMTGLVVAAALFIVLVIWGPGVLGHPAVGFTVLIGGGYVLAQLFGTFIGAQIGYRKAARKRDETWARYLADRSSNP